MDDTVALEHLKILFFLFISKKVLRDLVWYPNFRPTTIELGFVARSNVIGLVGPTNIFNFIF
jgi:hypothetical protein